MSTLKLSNGDDYPAATGKHLNDANALINAEPPRPDGAGYHARYAIECALRTVVMLGHMRHLDLDDAKEKGRKAPELHRGFRGNSNALNYKPGAVREVRQIGGKHDLEDLAKATTKYAEVLRADNANYVPALNTKNAPFGVTLSGQKDPGFSALRYRAEGDLTVDDAKKWIAEADSIYKATIGLRKRDGLIKV